MEPVPVDWAAAHFAGAPLGDVRRTRRVVTLARALLRRPGASLPQLAATPYAVKATYTLFAHPAVTPTALQAGHRARVHAHLHAADPAGAPVLLLEDTTVLSWAGQTPIAGLGPVGAGAGPARAQGFLLHSVLAVRWATPPAADTPTRPPLTILGLADQVAHVRTPAPAAEHAGPAGSRAHQRQHRWRESQLWREATTRLGRAPARATGVRWVRVCDREADIYEFLHECQAAGHGFVVRAAQDRRLAAAEARLWATLTAVPAQARLWATLTAVPAQGHVALALRGRDGAPGRTAHLALAAAEVALAPPRRPPGAPARGPLACTAVRIWEPTPPPGTEALEWRLLTDTPLATPDALVTCVQQYATRWAIEEFHKGLKTGLGAERLQLGHVDRLTAAVALLSVVAVQLLALKEWVHAVPDAPAAASGLPPLALALLTQQTQRRLATVRDVALALGRLGGHMNRKADGLPGWLTLWRGLQYLHALTEGAQLALDGKFG